MGETIEREERATGSPPWDRVSIAPPGAWVEEEGYDPAVAAKGGDHVTQLLLARQVDAETGTSFSATASRLETALAVQHESQWRLDLDARHSRLTLHWVRVVRGSARVDQLKRERLRLLQRETQLERHVIDGRWTLLLVLEDVRPGDVIEAAYSFETAHPIRPDGCEVFFSVPPQMRVGRYRLAVTSDPMRADLRWKAADDAPAMREEQTGGGRRRWVWEGSQPEPREPEPNQPGSHLDHTWIQVSDLADWESLAARVDAVWSAQSDAEALAEMPAFAKPATVDAAAIVALVREVQDEFRYLSMDLETSGWVPSSPSEVARRRHGDCKDLSWLAATVLRSWGVAARPVLVGAGLRERVADLLPMAGVFNHAILEVEHAGERRWFDLTLRDLGGDFAHQLVGWFGHGLVIHGTEGGLRAQPGRRGGGKYALRETILLHTGRGGVSLVEVRVRAEGYHADELRRVRLMNGAEAFWRDREELAKRRYGRARRLGEPCWRDDREANVCELVEVFEVTEAVYADETGRRAVFDAPPNLVLQTFLLPEDKPRRGPWDMPFPFEIAHEVVIKGPSLGVAGGSRRTWAEPEFDAAIERTRSRGTWTNRTRFRSGGPAVTAERLPEYRRRLEACFRELGWRLYLPWGQPRSRRSEELGVLDEPGTELITGPVLASEPGPVEERWRSPEVARGVQVIARQRVSRRSQSASEDADDPDAESRAGGPGGRGAWIFQTVWLSLAVVAFLMTRGCNL